MTADANHSLASNLHVLLLLSEPCQRLFQVHKAEIELLSFSYDIIYMPHAAQAHAAESVY